MEDSRPAMLWFERASVVLRLRFPLSVVVVGFLPILLFLVLGSEAAGYPAIAMSELSASIFLLPVVVVLLYLMRYVRKRLEDLSYHIESDLHSGVRIELESLCSLRGPFIVTAVLLTIFEPLFYVFSPLPLQEFIVQQPAWIYFVFIQATLIWVFSYSMYKIYQIGSLPLNLKSFAEDRTLGLRPIGRFSLQVTGAYFLYVILINLGTGPGLFPVVIWLPIVSGFLFLGIALFVVPLTRIRRQLMKAKRDYQSWITPQYAAVVDRMRSGPALSRDDRLLLSSELAAIDKIQRDIQQIHGWPFDTGIIIRLTAIMLTVTAILLAKVLGPLVGLR